jgi:hypothetical protein
MMTNLFVLEEYSTSRFFVKKYPNEKFINKSSNTITSVSVKKDESIVLIVKKSNVVAIENPPNIMVFFILFFFPFNSL